ncbi:hypothetical protein O6H91_12G016600 [Diphasiastrum complanatum]|uniref:Uncharacterized protein n=3 Tax=Diphasiastrum complanatum TaxID=34168 RepID=A0ACC2C0A9_DIPCM|nr:hypothetical protein O6H91_12G016600 [Diphasiastrum complanatum]KAJ7535054.1 hypothetical protein O6H91_12G016600 [Diphasiastrum complanatum]KAJ7535056.1 hypothetical protein O6H91_12G016600 [Diphasiastrum complanatum]
MFKAVAAPMCGCEPGAVVWIWQWFGDCVHTRWELVAFLVGVTSIFFWLVAQMPQYVNNIIRQNTDALSPWFLFQWLGGDLFNLLGCLLTGNQLATETFTAFYFIFADCMVISQYVYYQVRNRDKKGHYSYSCDSDESLHKPSFGYKDFMLGENMNCFVGKNEIHGRNLLDHCSLFKSDVEDQLYSIVQPANGIVADNFQGDSTLRIEFCGPSERKIMVEQPAERQNALEQGIGEQSSGSEQLRIQAPALTLQQSFKKAVCDSQLTDTRRADLISNALNPLRMNVDAVPREVFLQDFQDEKQLRCGKKVLVLPVKQQLGSRSLHRHLRRVVMEYGLEYGPPSVSRLNVNHMLRLKKFDLKRKSEKPDKIPALPVFKSNAQLRKSLCLATSMAVGSSRCHGAEGSSLLQNLAVQMNTPNFAKYFTSVTGSIAGRRNLKSLEQSVGTSGHVLKLQQILGGFWSSAVVLDHLNTSNEKLAFLPCNDSNQGLWWPQRIGLLFGWASSVLYLGSRISQLVKNNQRKSAEGLSLAMVMCALLANLTYGLAILMRTNSWEDIVGKAPWVVGSLGTVSLDIAILLQAQYFKNRCGVGCASEYTPLLA